jgi:hypothetical protein
VTVRLIAVEGTPPPARDVSGRVRVDDGPWRELTFTGAGDGYVAGVTATTRGRYTFELKSPAELRTEVDVATPDAESGIPTSDPEVLAALALDSGGAVLRDGTLQELRDVLPSDRAAASVESRDSLWDRAWVYLVVALLACGEWAFRKWVNLA